MSCASPIDPAVLTDYWLAALPSAEEAAVEEHLFTCDECGARLREAIAFARAARALAGDGSLIMILPDAFVKRVIAQGKQVREYVASPGGRIACTISLEDDFLIGRLQADLSGAKQLDLGFYSPDGAELIRLADVPFDPASGNIVFQQSATFAKGARSSTMIARLLARDAAGEERMLGEYTFDHTRTIAGPGLW